MNNFGENLKKVRESKNLTQQAIAEQLYVTRQAVSRWECGARYPDLITTKKLSQILEVSIDELLQNEDIKNYENIKKSTNRKIITSLFIITIIFNVIFTAIYLKEILSVIAISQLNIRITFNAFQVIFNTALLILMFILHIRKILISKYIGLALSAYFLISIIEHIIISVTLINIMPNIILKNILPIIFYIINIVIILKYFNSDKIKSPIPVYICIFLNFLVSFSSKIQIYTLTNQGIINFDNEHKILLYYIIQAVQLFAGCSAFALVFYITYLLGIEKLKVKENK